MTSKIAQAQTPCARLKILREVWGIRLRIASALLTVLYPQIFTPYDVSALEVLGNLKDF